LEILGIRIFRLSKQAELMDEVVGGCILRDDSVPSGKERGRWPSTSCGVTDDDHDNKFGRPLFDSASRAQLQVGSVSIP
jgi:hypothetical protein